MDPLTDFDRALREAMRVEPDGDFAARLRTRVAAAPRESRVLARRFALVAVACALLAVIATGVWRHGHLRYSTDVAASRSDCAVATAASGVVAG